MCQEWQLSFLTFRTWALSHGYQLGLEIDREDNDGNYSPDNCRFVTRKQNCRNRRSTKLTPQAAAEIKENKEGLTPLELSRKYGVHRNSIYMVRAGQTWN